MTRLKFLGATRAEEETKWVYNVPEDATVIMENGGSSLIKVSNAKFVLKFVTDDEHENKILIDIYPFFNLVTSIRLTDSLCAKIELAVMSNQEGFYINENYDNCYNLIISYSDVKRIKNLDKVIKKVILEN